MSHDMATLEGPSAPDNQKQARRGQLQRQPVAVQALQRRHHVDARCCSDDSAVDTLAEVGSTRRLRWGQGW